MKEKQYSVKATNINKKYKMYSSSKQKLLDLLLPKGAGKDFYALKDLSFEVKKGECVGLIGMNGAGKSTLSNILAGVSLPSNGEIDIVGEPAIIAIGSGLNNFLTGMENIEVKALMMGFKKEKIEEIKKNVIDFAEIGEFINQPIRTYSSGMRSRLGFAISVHMDPDILVIDEALSVGDQTFTKKCLDKMNEFKERGKTIFFVSHSISQVREFCDKAIWLEYGMLKDYDNVDIIVPKYKEYLDNINKMTKEEKIRYKEEVLKIQQHSLLNEFKFIDQNMKKIKIRGKILTYAVLINKKKNEKIVPYNFDYLTFIFGGITSILRKQYTLGALICLLEIVAIFISSGIWCVFNRFIIVLIFSFFTGKGYIDFLIEEKGYIPYEFYIKINENKDNKISKKDIKYLSRKNIKKRIQKNNIMLCGLLVALLSSILAFVNMEKLFSNNEPVDNAVPIEMNSEEENVVEKEMPTININKNILLMIKDGNLIDSFAFIDIDTKKDNILVNYYTNELKIQGKYNPKPLNKFIKERIETGEEIIKKGFNKENYDTFIINKNIDYETLGISSYSRSDIFKDIIKNISKVGSNKYKNIFNLKEDKNLKEYETYINNIIKENKFDDIVKVQKGKEEKILIK